MGMGRGVFTLQKVWRHLTDARGLCIERREEFVFQISRDIATEDSGVTSRYWYIQLLFFFVRSVAVV